MFNINRRFNIDKTIDMINMRYTYHLYDNVVY